MPLDPPDSSTSSPRTFKRMKSSLESTLKNATRSKVRGPRPSVEGVDESTITRQKNRKGKDKEGSENAGGLSVPQHQQPEKSMLRRLESKVTFRRSGRESITPSPSPVPPMPSSSETATKGHKHSKSAAPVYLTPSIRQASMSSPAVHLSSQAIPSPNSRSAVPVSSSSGSVAALVSPPRELRDRTRRASMQPPASGSNSNYAGNTSSSTAKRASMPLVAASSSRDSRDGDRNVRTDEGDQYASSSNAAATPRKTRTSRPPPIQTTSTNSSSANLTTLRSPTPTRRTRDHSSPPATPTPASSSSRTRLGEGHRPPPLLSSSSPRKMASSSSGHLPLSPPLSPRERGGGDDRATTPLGRGESPIRRRGLASSSSTHLPRAGIASSSSTNLPSMLNGSPSSRRPSVEIRRTSIDGRRPSFDISRQGSDSPSRQLSSADSPVRRASRTESPSLRPRAKSPNTGSSYTQNRHFNMSTTSLSATPNPPEWRESIRAATTILCREMIKPPPYLGPKGGVEWEEVEARMRALMRLERIWGKSGALGASSSQISVTGGLSSSGLSAGGEEREKRLFGEALRDGYVLCQFMNKIRVGAVIRPDPREDRFIRTANVTKYLASCTQYGLEKEDLFQRDDLVEATAESLARVARNIVSLSRYAESPDRDRGGSSAFVLHGQAPRRNPSENVYSSSRGAASTPNLSMSQLQQPSVSPSPPSPTTNRNKRWSPPSGLPTVRSNSPGEGSSTSRSGTTVSSGKTEDAAATSRHGRGSDRVGGRQEFVDTTVPASQPIMAPPPRSPLRPSTSSSFPPKRPLDEGYGSGGLFGVLATAASGSSSPSPSSHSPPEPDRNPWTGESSSHNSNNGGNLRASVASSAMSETTAYSSLLEVRYRTNSENKFGTVRTFTTEATSEAPSFTRTEGSSVAASLVAAEAAKREHRYSRERRPSEHAVVDLSRVQEEAESANGSSSRGGGAGVKRAESRDRAPVIRLGQGKWPEDFMDAMQARNKTAPADLDDDLPPPSPTTSQITPPRKLAIVGQSRRNDSSESLPQFPRRPSHRPRHSLDAPVLLPKTESMLRRDASPESVPNHPSRLNPMLRRHSTKNGPSRNGVYIPRGSLDDPRASAIEEGAPVPFPRTASGEHAPPNIEGVPGSSNDRPRLARGRFQSDVEATSSRRKARPNSFDELGGGRPQRSRIESMANLGVQGSSTRASDLMNRDSMDGNAVRKPLIVREEGKPPTHFQLGNCIGRGQFGSVYRALNLNTGQMVAVKRIRLEGLKEEEVTQLMQEVDLVKSLSHPSIVKYEGMARDVDTLSIVLEYAENGSLGQTLKAFGKFNERLVAGYVVKILEGLHYLHTCDVVHCDLKAANILTTKTGNVKLSDFGVSLNLRAMEREMKDVAGTPNWMAPEVIELKGASTKSDIWSLACTVIELFTGRPPYSEIANSMTVMFRIVEDERPPIPEGCSPLLHDFLEQCFDKDPEKRPSAELLCEHPWLKKNLPMALRPQDSIPFLRRVSADMQKSEVVRYLSQIEMPESPITEGRPHPEEIPFGSPPRNRRDSSGLSAMRPMEEQIAPRAHSFVKTSFSKAMVCRVCLLNVKKSAVLCEQCSLIAHSKCAGHAPPTCDLRAQLLLYAQYAEKGNPVSPYQNPVEVLTDIQPANLPTSPMSDVSFVLGSPRSSIDIPRPAPGGITLSAPIVHPPTTFKFMGAFKRSKSSVTPEGAARSSNTSLPTHQPTILESNTLRPPDIILSDTAEDRQSDVPSGSMRSTATATTDPRSGPSIAESELPTPRYPGAPQSRVSSFSVSPATEPDEKQVVPGEMPTDHRKHKRGRESKSSSGGCVTQ